MSFRRSAAEYVPPSTRSDPAGHPVLCNPALKPRSRVVLFATLKASGIPTVGVGSINSLVVDMFAPEMECTQRARSELFEYSAQGNSTPKETGLNCLNAEFSAMEIRSGNTTNGSLSAQSQMLENSKGSHVPESMVDPFSSAAQHHMHQPYTL